MNYLTFSPRNWNEQISRLPNSHLLQTWQWGHIKALYGWTPQVAVWSQTRPGEWQMLQGKFHQDSTADTSRNKPVSHDYTQPRSNTPPTGSIDAAALILQRSLSLGGMATRIKILYTPKGPLLDWNNIPLRRKVIADLQALAHQSGAIFVKIDPDVRLGEGIPGQSNAQEDLTGQQVTEDLSERGWLFSQEQIQFRNTVFIDLTPNENQLLSQMKQKTRYNIRLAERKGVTIRVGEPADWELLYRMYAITSMRDGFVIRDEAYYHTVWDTFTQTGETGSQQQPLMEPLIAEVTGEPAAAVIIYRFAGKAWYLSGMSTDSHREKMPNYLLQWEAMRRAKAAGCTHYDLWGAPENFNEQDSLWGVYRFKEGLGGKVLRTLGAWDYPARSLLYKGYTQILPRLLDAMRHRGNARTRQVLLGS